MQKQGTYKSLHLNKLTLSIQKKLVIKILKTLNQRVVLSAFFGVFLLSTNLKAQLYSDSISVNFFLLDDCIICQKSSPYIEAIYQDFGNDTFHIQAFFPNFVSKPKNIESFLNKFNLSIPYKTDYFKNKSTQLNATVLPEVIVRDEKQERILYQGRINDLFAGVGKQRRVIRHHDLRNALLSIQKQEEIKVKNTEAVGCLINFGEF